jgi:hypothetical protein
MRVLGTDEEAEVAPPEEPAGVVPVVPGAGEP